MGATCYVTSSSIEKIEFAKSLGATDGFLYTEADWEKPAKKACGGVDVIIDGAGGSGFSKLLKLSNPGARIAVYGGTSGVWENLRPADVFYKQVNIFGTTMGSDLDFKEMLQFVTSNKIQPHIDSCYPLSEGSLAIERMESGLQLGKIVLNM
jgi:NADPH:quinone reductase-like Zn-dependent oxidoreductase